MHGEEFVSFSLSRAFSSENIAMKGTLEEEYHTYKKGEIAFNVNIPPMIEQLPLDHVGTGAAMPQITHRAQTNLTFNFPLNA